MSLRISIDSLLHHCARTRSFRHGTSIHAATIKLGRHSDTFIANHIVNMYSKCGRVSQARQLFDEMPTRNLVSWSALMSGCNQSGQHFLAMELFSQMRIVPNEYIYASVLSSCAAVRSLLYGQQVHARAMKYGHACVVLAANALVSLYMKLGQPGDAVLVHSRTSEPSLVSYNVMVSGFVENHLPERAFETFKAVLLEEFIPDKFTFVVMSGLCPAPAKDNLIRGEALHCLAVKLCLDSIAFVGNIVMTMYSNFNLLASVYRAFGSIVDRDIFSWNTLITAHTQNEEHWKGVYIFREMLSRSGVCPDDFTYASVLAACAGSASICHGKQIHAHLIRASLLQDIGVYNALVNMYAKCGCLENGYNLFNRMRSRNLVSWNTLIVGFGNHGLSERAFETFEQMIQSGLKPDSVTFSGLLIACNHTGLVDKGLSYYKSMEEDYGISPVIEHFSCLIDMLGRAGRLQEAEDYIRKSSFGNDPIILGSLLSACRFHGDISVGEYLAGKILELKPQTTSPYVLLSNLHASGKAWDSVIKARKLLKNSGLKKEPGCSLIEVKGICEKFTTADLSHSKAEEMKNLLGILNWAVEELSSYRVPCYSHQTSEMPPAS